LTSHRNTGSNIEKHNLLQNTSRINSNSSSNIINVNSNIQVNLNPNKNPVINNGHQVNIHEFNNRSDPIINYVNNPPIIKQNPNPNQRGTNSNISINSNNHFVEQIQNDSEMVKNKL
jgi:hypothetical protein